MLFELINKYHMYNGTSNTTTNNRVTMFLSFFGFCAKKGKGNKNYLFSFWRYL